MSCGREEYPFHVKRVLARCRRCFHRLRHLDLTNFRLWPDNIRRRGDRPAVNTSIHSASSASPSIHVAMLVLHAVVVQHAAVWLPMPSTIDQLHMPGRHDGRGRSRSTTALQNALAEQRQLSAAICSSRSLRSRAAWMDGQFWCTRPEPERPCMRLGACMWPGTIRVH